MLCGMAIVMALLMVIKINAGHGGLRNGLLGLLGGLAYQLIEASNASREIHSFSRFGFSRSLATQQGKTCLLPDPIGRLTL